MSHTVFEFSWGHYVAVPNERVSSMLKLLEECFVVDNLYVNNDTIWYIKDNPRKLTMQLVNRFVPEKTAQDMLNKENKDKQNGA